MGLVQGWEAQERGSRSRGRHRSSGRTACHPLDVANHVVEGRVVGQDEIFVHRESELVADVRHDLGLFHRINPQFTFQILVQFDEISGIARVFHHHGHDRGGHFGIVDHGGGCWNGHFGCNDGSRFRGTRGRLGAGAEGATACSPPVMRWM